MLSEQDEERLTTEIEDIKNMPQNIQELFNMMLSAMKDYIDIAENELKKIVCWAIASTIKDIFETFPILYVNAPMSSGKSRLLKVLNAMIPNSLLTTNLTEAVLFRVPQAHNLNALLIDEAENITNKEKGNLKELLNSCYKKGVTVLRMKKIENTQQYEAEEFIIFLPVALANITGLEGVVESRSISTILERSNNLEITRKMELFSFDYRFRCIKKYLEAFSVGWENYNTVLNSQKTQQNASTDKSVGSVCRMGINNTYREVCLHFNSLMNTSYTHTYTTQHTQPTLIINKIKETDIGGRDLELWLPLFCVASFISEELLNEIVNIAIGDILIKKETTAVEDRDTTFLMFLYLYLEGHSINSEYYKVSDIREEFRFQEGIGKTEYFPSSEWIGRALKRLKLLNHKRRVAKGIEVNINKNKIRERILKMGLELPEIVKEEAPKHDYQESLDEI